MEVDEPNLRLDTLPAELLLHILQYLEVGYITSVVARVCSYFNNIASDPATWKIRLSKRFPGQYPALPPPPQFSWSRACHAREKESYLWPNSSSQTACLTSQTAHYGAVDSVQVLDNVIVSGSRDRAICLWTVDQVLSGGEEAQRPSLRKADMHRGWVWTFCGKDDVLVSGSWDSTVKFWQITPTELKETIKPVQIKVAILSTDMLGERVVAGTYDKKVIMIDRREGPHRLTFYRVHTMPVLAVKITERQIWSVSEDQNLVIYDRAAGKRMKTIRMPGHHFPMCMANQGNSLWIGDKGGSLHHLDISGDKFEVLDTVSSGHKGRVTSVHCGLGSLITASSDGDIQSPYCGEVAQISYNENNQVLAAGFSNNTVKIWAATSHN